MISYPSVNKIIELNFLVLSVIVVKKADRPEILSHVKISSALKHCENFEGDLYDKAATLMKALIKNHAFASGNRRTAFIATKYFLKINNGKFKIPNDPLSAKVMQGIREEYYSHEEIKE
ncbi:type II toxin-antitoxin system death-on-curing family toxin [Candidatus Woesearchaeota archaeon]|nr:type II toxin-antitoxin system death-on-curing family toxin [Candidatus Woesearchaeota archaeon]